MIGEHFDIVDEGGLARTSRANDAHHLPHLKTHLFDQLRLLRLAMAAAYGNTAHIVEREWPFTSAVTKKSTPVHGFIFLRTDMTLSQA